MTQFGSHLPYPSQYNIVPGENVVVAQDATLYISPSGSDAVGNGTEAAPFATLKKAWETAQTYVIRGNAILYITFLRGYYNITSHEAFFPENLYHPQGGNIIIQGDPRAVKQSYLYRVNEYSWDYGRYSHHGHTGSVKLWSRGATTDINLQTQTGVGTTAHGYSAGDVGGYVAISSPFFSSPTRYYDYQNRIYSNRYCTFRDGDLSNQTSSAWTLHRESTSEAYKSLWYGHQPRSSGPTKHGHQFGIIGLARIEGASTDAYNLRLAFRNSNLDPRALTFLDESAGRVNSGAASSAPLHGVAGNLPSNQLYDPVGYYGATYAWGRNSTSAVPTGRADLDDQTYTAGVNGNAGTDPSVYPSGASAFDGGAVTHVTDDTLLVSSYPAVLSLQDFGHANGRRIPFNIKGSRLRALRNLFILDASLNGTAVGATADRRSIGWGMAGRSSNLISMSASPSCISIIDSEVDIRHIGIESMSTSDPVIQIIRSKVGVYSDYSGWQPTTAAAGYAAERDASGAPDIHARLGSSNNTPVLMVDGSRSTAVYVLDSDVKLTVGSSPETVDASDSIGVERRIESKHEVDESVWIQNHGCSTIFASNSSLVLGSAIINCNSQFPSRSWYFYLPYWFGMTAEDRAGAVGEVGYTSGAYSPITGLGSGSQRRSNVVYYETPTTPAGSKGFTLGRIWAKISQSNDEQSATSGSFTTATFLKDGVADPGPSAGNGSGWRYFGFYFTGVGTEINKIWETGEIDSTAPTSLLGSGFTLAIHSFTDMTETTDTSSYVKIHKNGIIMKAPGATYAANGANIGLISLSVAYTLRPFENGSALIPGEPNRHSCISLSSSRLILRKNLVLKGGAYGIAALNGSHFTPRSTDTASRFPYACVMSEMQTQGGVAAFDGSHVRLPSYLTKDPPVVGINGSSSIKYPSAGFFHQLYAARGSRIELMGDAILVSPTRTPNEAWTTQGGVRLSYGAASDTSSTTPSTTTELHQRISPVRVEANSVITCPDISRNVIILASDGLVYNSGTLLSDYKDSNAIFVNQTTGSVVGPFHTVPVTIVGGISGSNTPDGNFRIGGWRVLGWSGPVAGSSYKIQTRETDATKKFSDQLQSNPQWRFWNNGYGFTTGSTPSTVSNVFYQLPIMINDTVSVYYGESSTVAVDGTRSGGQSPYGERVLAASHVFPSTGVSYAFVRGTSSTTLNADGGAITKYPL